MKGSSEPHEHSSGTSSSPPASAAAGVNEPEDWAASAEALRSAAAASEAASLCRFAALKRPIESRLKKNQSCGDADRYLGEGGGGPP